MSGSTSTTNGSTANEKSLYEILGLKSNCSPKEITEAHEKVKQKYPRHTNSKEYKDALAAYATLIDPVKRDFYNSFKVINADLATVKKQYSFESQFFENPAVKDYLRVEASTSKEIKHTLYVSLEDLYTGASVPTTICHNVPCSSCAVLNICRCVSLGKLATQACKMCHGTGVRKQHCMTCKNQKVIKKNELLHVKIEKGTKHGDVIRMQSQQVEGNAPAIFCISIKERTHSDFVRMGDDLHYHKSINITGAICGCQFVVKHLDKRQLAVSTAGMVVFNGCQKSIKAEGMPFRYSSTNADHGDLIIRFIVKFPDKINLRFVPELKSLLPSVPEFTMPTECDEYKLTDFDPSYKRTHWVKKPVYDDDKSHVKFDRKSTPCTQQ
uniref:J domain-containing protein n=1 Tax=Ciona savignyi TaxID=51511 RepID=H2ZDA5_CIOSA